MDLIQLKQLKAKLCVAKDFGEVMNFFFDIAEQPGFMDHGEKVADPHLAAIVEMVGQALFHKDVKLKHFLPVRIDQFKFTHGAGVLNDLPMNVIYFDEIEKGLVAVLMGGNRTQFIRITKKDLPAGFEQLN